jgi:hypothetical protein
MIGPGRVGESPHSSPKLHTFRLTTTKSTSFFLHLNHIRHFPSSWNSIGTEIGMGSMRQSSKWRFEDEGSDSLVILGPMDREGAKGQVLSSHTPWSAGTQGGRAPCD